MAWPLRGPYNGCSNRQAVPVQLIATPDNPIPRQAVVASITTSDGIALRVARWKQRGKTAKGTVCILQGRAEFIEKYFEVVTELRNRGFAVVTFDWRGQGFSGRQVKNLRKGHVRRFSDYRRDLEAVRDKVLIPEMPEPHFVLAHSMGGAIALDAAHAGWLPFKRLVATTPMIALCIIKRQEAAAFTARVLHWLGFGQGFRPGRRRDFDRPDAVRRQPPDERSGPLCPQRGSGDRRRPCRRRATHRRVAQLGVPLHAQVRSIRASRSIFACRP